MVQTWEIVASLLAICCGALFGLSGGHEPMTSMTLVGGLVAGAIFRWGKQREVYGNATAANPTTCVTPFGLAGYSFGMAAACFFIGYGIVYRLG